MRARTVVILVLVVAVAVTLVVVLAPLVVLGRLNAGMVRRRWLAGRPPVLPRGRDGRLLGELAAGAVGYLAGKRGRL